MTSDLEKALSLQRAGRIEESKRIYRRLIRRRPDDHAALHWLGIAFAQQEDLGEAEAFLKRAALIAPREAMYLANLATVLKKLGRSAESLECYQRALAIRPDDRDTWNNFGSALLEAGKPEEALACFDKALALAGGFFDALMNAGIAQQALGRLDQATESFTRAIAARPGEADAHSNLGLVLQLRGQAAQAEAALTEAVRLDPANAGAQNNLGLVYLAQGEPGKAEPCFRIALRAARPHPDVHANLATALERLGRADEAIRACREALSKAGEQPQLLAALGNALRTAGRIEESIAMLRRAVVLDPGSFGARSALGLSLLVQGSLAEAFAEFSRALELRPDDPPTLSNLGLCRLGLADAVGAVELFRRAASLDPGYVKARSNLLLALNYLPSVSPTELFEAHSAFAETFEAPLRAAWPVHRNPRDPERRLRLAYVSGDFYEHAVAFFTEPVFALHDRRRFEVFCLDTGNRGGDLFTSRFRQHADHWHSIAQRSDQSACELVHELGIDVLVDLSGHTVGNRLGLFMRKPAPVQVHWLGYLTTTGLHAMDYRITDAKADPPGESERYYSEKLVRLPTVWAFAGPGEAHAEVAPLPCLQSGRFTFACYNAVAKITEEVIECWSALLREVPESTLALGNAADAALVAKLSEAFARRGVAPSRLHFAPRRPLSGFLELHHQVDLALDPFPYGGGATTCHALWMGVPLVTLKGDRYMARIGSDMLEQLGLERFIARSTQEYVAIASHWSQRPEELAQIRRALRGTLQASTLGDVPRFVSALESAYRDMWRTWCGA